MAVKEIKTRFKLEGEQQFKRTMTESAAAVKVLNSEEKLAEAQFKATGDTQSYAAEKSRILKEQIKQQQAAVKAAEDAIKQLTKQGVQPNDKAMQTWKTKLNTAKTNLVNMETQLNKTEAELKEQKTAVEGVDGATQGYNTSMDKVAKGVDLQNTITAIDNLKGHIEGIVSKAAQAAKAIWEMGVDSGKWADDLITASTQAGLDVETYQSWQYASRFIDSSVQDIVGSFGDIDKKLKEEGETAKKYRESLAEIGVATYKSSGEMRTSNEIFWDAIDGLHNLTDEADLNRKATLLFGNDWRKLQPLIQAGSKGFEEMAQSGRDLGVVLSSDQVAALGGVDDQMQKVEAQAEALKNGLMAGLSPTFQTVAQALSDANKALSDFLKSEEGQAALTSLNEALSGIIKSFLGEDGGQGTFKSIVEGASGAVSEFTKLLEWISNNGDAVKGILMGIAATWTGLSVFKEALLVTQLIQTIGNSNFGQFLMNKGKTAGDAANAVSASAPAASGATGLLGATAGLTGATAVFLGGSVQQWNENMAGKQAAKDAGEAVVAEVERTTDIVAEKLGQETAALRDEMVRKATEAMVPVTDTSAGYVPGLGMTVAPTTENRSALIETINYMKQNADTIQKLLSPETYSQIMSANPNGGFLGIGSMGNSDLLALVKKATDEMAEAGRGAGDGLAGGMSEKADDVKNAAQGLADAGTDTITQAWDEHSPSKVFSAIGANASIGLANGINSRAGDAIRAAQSLANRVTAIMRQALQIHSPSAVFEELGAYTGEGFALGLERSVGNVDRAVGRMLTAVRAPLRYAPESAMAAGVTYRSTGAQGGSEGRTGAQTAHVTLMLDKDVLADTMVPLVDAEMGAKIQATRR